MHCPFCSAVDTKVIDSRLVAEGHQVRRRRECLLCHERFYHLRNGRTGHAPRHQVQRLPASPSTKTNCGRHSAGAGEAAGEHGGHREGGQPHQSPACGPPASEVASQLVGNLVMDELKSLDKVAYIRFASVYRSFEDIREFGEEIAKLEK